MQNDYNICSLIAVLKVWQGIYLLLKSRFSGFFSNSLKSYDLTLLQLPVCAVGKLLFDLSTAEFLICFLFILACACSVYVNGHIICVLEWMEIVFIWHKNVCLAILKLKCISVDIAIEHTNGS